MNDPIAVVIVDDHPLYRDGLRAMIAAAPDMVVAGEASDGASGAACVVERRPDVVLMDLQMPELNGVDATRRIVAAGVPTAVVVLTMSESDESILAALDAGARGYVLKGADRDELLAAIRAAAAGNSVLAAQVAERLIRSATGPPRRAMSAFPELTDRELEILELIAAGESNGQIARRLVVTEKTVRNHITNIFSKLEVRDRAQAIVKAREAGLGGR